MSPKRLCRTLFGLTLAAFILLSALPAGAAGSSSSGHRRELSGRQAAKLGSAFVQGAGFLSTLWNFVSEIVTPAPPQPTAPPPQPPPDNAGGDLGGTLDPNG